MNMQNKKKKRQMAPPLLLLLVTLGNKTDDGSNLAVVIAKSVLAIASFVVANRKCPVGGLNGLCYIRVYHPGFYHACISGDFEIL